MATKTAAVQGLSTMSSSSVSTPASLLSTSSSNAAACFALACQQLGSTVLRVGAARQSVKISSVSLCFFVVVDQILSVVAFAFVEFEEIRLSWSTTWRQADEQRLFTHT
jgi:hypothetical protein